MRRAPFTVLEVLVAVAILAMAMGAALAIAGQARARLLRAETRRQTDQALANAAEWFLLTAPGGPPCPDHLLPTGWQARCRVRPVGEAHGGWVLVAYTVAVEPPSGGGRELTIRRLLREDDR